MVTLIFEVFVELWAFESAYEICAIVGRFPILKQDNCSHSLYVVFLWTFWQYKIFFK